MPACQGMLDMDAFARFVFACIPHQPRLKVRRYGDDPDRPALYAVIVMPSKYTQPLPKCDLHGMNPFGRIGIFIHRYPSVNRIIVLGTEYWCPVLKKFNCDI